VARTGATTVAYRILVKNLKKEIIGKTKNRQEDNTKMDLKCTGWEDVDWINVAQAMDKWWVLANKEINIWVPQNAGSFLAT
jgi:hypothetical protein